MADPFDHLPDAAKTDASADPFAHIPDAPPQVSNWESSKAGRFMTGVKEPFYGAAQLAAHATGYGVEAMDKRVADLEKRYQASRSQAGIKPEDWDYMAGLGNIASPINYLPGAVAGRVLGTAGRAASLGTRLGEGALVGATQGATTPVADTADYGDKKLYQTVLGAGVGAAGVPIGRAVGAVVAPEITPAARALANEGVELTPGQTAGGLWKSVEDTLAPVPFIGAPIRSAQERGVISLDRAAGQRALTPIGEHLDPAARSGHAIAEDVSNRLGQRYEQIHNATSLTMDDQLQNDLQAIARQHATLGPERLGQLQSYIDQHIEQPLVDHGGTLPGAVIHGAASNLRREAANLATDPNAFTRNLGTALGDVHDALNDALERQNPGFAAQLQAVNTGWANYVRIRQAAASTAAQAHEGSFTGTQLGMATKAMDRSAGKGQSARGNALMQDLAENARQVMPSKMGSSGTAERAAMLGVMGGHLAVSPQTAVASALMPLLYSRYGSNAVRNFMLAPRGAAMTAAAPTLAGLAPRASATGALSSTNEDAKVGQNFANLALRRRG